MVDLDHFKAINDTYGYLGGDSVLHGATQYFANKLRPYDWMCRYGGEEFLICLPNTKPKTAKKIVNRLCLGLVSLRIDLDKENAENITASFGIAKMVTDIRMEDTIARADEALYAAKHGGRNQVIVYEEIKPGLESGRNEDQGLQSLSRLRS